LEKGFKAYRAVYDVVRGADLTGDIGTKITSVFGASGFVCSDAAKPLIEAAGFDQLARTGDGGVCGVATQEATSNFTTNSQVDTETDLTAESINNNKVKLTATVDASSSPIGAVTFKEDGVAIGADVDVTGGKAVKTLTFVSLGDHTYSATFTPETPAFAASSSDPVETSVKTPTDLSVGILSPIGSFGSVRLAVVAATIDGAPATGHVTVRVDSGASVQVTLIGGVGFYTIPGTSAVGSHTLTASLAGTADYSADTATAPLKVTKATTKATIKLADATIKASTTPKATVTVVINGAAHSVKPNGKITLRYGSKTVGKGTVVNGVAKVTLSKFKKKSSAYSIKATFTSTSGNYSNSPASAAVKLKVS